MLCVWGGGGACVDVICVCVRVCACVGACVCVVFLGSDSYVTSSDVLFIFLTKNEILHFHELKHLRGGGGGGSSKSSLQYFPVENMKTYMYIQSFEINLIQMRKT